MCMRSWNRQKRGGVFKIYHEPLSPNERACSRYVMNRNHQIKGRRVFRYVVNWTRHTSRVSKIKLW